MAATIPSLPDGFFGSRLYRKPRPRPGHKPKNQANLSADAGRAFWKRSWPCPSPQLTRLPDLKFDVDETVSEMDKLVVAWTLTGTHRGEFLGIAATNKKISVSGITINQIANGKILESTVQWDVVSLMQQLGITVPLKFDVLAASVR